MSKLLVVVGITGQQGGSVAEVYSKEPGWKVRGISRDPSKAQSWRSKGVEVVKGDLNDTSSLIAAFKGADAIFSNTDFWNPFFNPATREKLKPGQSLNEYCYNLELQQGKNVADAAATVGSLGRLILSGAADVSKATRGKYTHTYHFDSKAHMAQYVREKFPELAAKMSVVYVATYMNNWKSLPAPTKVDKNSPTVSFFLSSRIFTTQIHTDTPTQQLDGSYRFSNVGSGQKPIPLVDTVKDTGYIVRAALQSPPGKTILGSGDALSWSGLLKVWCEANKVPFGGYDEIPFDAYVDNMPVPDLGLEFAEMFAFMDEFGYTGGEEGVVHVQDLGVPCPLTTWEEHVKAEHAWADAL
ncbi:MAG: hypothetical protein Q9161_005939 [Pseudevernia consocians]